MKSRVLSASPRSGSAPSYDNGGRLHSKGGSGEGGAERPREPQRFSAKENLEVGPAMDMMRCAHHFIVGRDVENTVVAL
jgi:hypothetical protein